MRKDVTLPAQIADGLVTACVVFAVVSIAASTPAYIVFAEIAAAVAYDILFQWRLRAVNQEAAKLVLTTAALGLVWGLQFGSGSALLGVIGWLVYLARRVRSSGRLHDSDVQTPRLIWDFAFLVCAWLFCEISTVQELRAPQTALLLLLAGLPAVVSRLIAMHRAHLESANGGDARLSRTIWLPLTLLSGVVIALLTVMTIFPSARNAALLILAGAFGLYVLVALWRDLLTGFAVFLVLAGILYLIMQLAPRHPVKHPSRGGVPGRLPAHATGIHPSLFPHLDYGLIFLISALCVISFLALRARRGRGDARLLEAGLRVERSRIPALHPPKRGSRPPSPLRRLVLRWLRQEAHSGSPIRKGETLREYGWRRLRERKEAGEDTEVFKDEEFLLRVIERYETERYGLRPARDNEAKRIEHTLRERGYL